MTQKWKERENDVNLLYQTTCDSCRAQHQFLNQRAPMSMGKLKIELLAHRHAKYSFHVLFTITLFTLMAKTNSTQGTLHLTHFYRFHNADINSWVICPAIYSLWATVWSPPCRHFETYIFGKFMIYIFHIQLLLRFNVVPLSKSLNNHRKTNLRNTVGSVTRYYIINYIYIHKYK